MHNFVNQHKLHCPIVLMYRNSIYLCCHDKFPSNYMILQMVALTELYGTCLKSGFMVIKLVSWAWGFFYDFVCHSRIMWLSDKKKYSTEYLIQFNMTIFLQILPDIVRLLWTVVWGAMYILTSYWGIVLMIQLFLVCSPLLWSPNTGDMSELFTKHLYLTILTIIKLKQTLP